MLGGAAPSFVRTGVPARVGQPLKPSQAVVDRRFRQLHAPGQLTQVELGVLAAPASHLAQGRREALPLAAPPRAAPRVPPRPPAPRARAGGAAPRPAPGPEPLDRRRLPQARSDRL